MTECCRPWQHHSTGWESEQEVTKEAASLCLFQLPQASHLIYDWDVNIHPFRAKHYYNVLRAQQKIKVAKSAPYILI